jgi:uncharacterized RDD family membrane protein YckC
MEQTTPDLLNEFEERAYLETVSPGVRFANYIVDILGMGALFFIGGLVYAATLINDDGSFNSDAATTTSAMEYVVNLLIFVGYYTLLEGATKGLTLGKLVTGTIVVKEDGSPITFKEAFLRSLCRLVPFEPFSAFGKPWHDSWTNTLVVKRRK